MEEIKGKKIHYQDKIIGEALAVKNIQGSTEKVVIFETSKNHFKVIPLAFLQPNESGLALNYNIDHIDNFAPLSNKDLESDSDKFIKSVKTQYGEPDTWSKRADLMNTREDQSYMGSEISNPSLENRNIEEEVNYDKIKGNKD